MSLIRNESPNYKRQNNFSEILTKTNESSSLNDEEMLLVHRALQGNLAGHSVWSTNYPDSPLHHYHHYMYKHDPDSPLHHYHHYMYKHVPDSEL